MPPCQFDTAADWRVGPAPDHATTSAAARWLRADSCQRCGTSSCRYRCRLRRASCRVSVTWRAPVFGAPCQHSLQAGREHGRTIPLADIDAFTVYGLATMFVGVRATAGDAEN